jgi:hypothetical protein
MLREVDIPGEVAVRVMKGLMDDGSYIEDEVGGEYFAGVVAASRSANGSDDAGVTLIEIMNGLSSVQLRAHYALYSAAQRAVASRRGVDLHSTKNRDNWSRLAVPSVQFLHAVAGPDQANWAGDVVGPIMRGLKRMDLIDANAGWVMGRPEVLRAIERDAQWPCPAVVFTVTNFGIELFCAAHGFRTLKAFKRPYDDFVARFKAQVPSCEPFVVADLPSYPEDALTPA